MQPTPNDFALAASGGIDSSAQSKNGSLSAPTDHQIVQVDARYKAPQAEPTRARLVQGELASYLRSHLARPSAIKQLLGPLANSDPSLIGASIESEFQKSKGRLFNSVADFKADGERISEALTDSPDRLWLALQDASKPSQAFGRIVRIHSFTPITVLQLLVYLGDYFEIERVLSTFISKGPSICYHPNPATQMGDTWFFCMKYYYLSSGGQTAYLGQQSGNFHETKQRVVIYRGSSSVALEFEEKEDEDETTASTTPWRLWINSCAQGNSRPQPDMLSGVQAYLWGVNHELEHVRRSLRIVSYEISSIAVPSDEYLLDNELRESVLFEDASYTNSRTYFWALQSFRIINECINSLITAWEMSNTSRILGAVQPDRESTPVENEIARILTAIEGQIEKLKELVRENDKRQEEIIALRDGLFSTSAVLEARTTVTQGENIKILTYVSLLFLPASFSTSIFGMQSILPVSTRLSTFAIVMVCVCGPTYLLIWFLSWRKGRKFAATTKRKALYVFDVEYRRNREDWAKRKGEWLNRSKRKSGKGNGGDIERGK